MNGAESLARTLVGCGVDVCFANPGTSEMHFVAALDRVAGIRCVLGLFEGVVTGAADGYARMADKPAATLLHLGPGLGNGLANLHNAKKAMTPMINIIGDHTTYHRRYDAPLTADIEGIARPVSHWLRTSTDARSVAADGAEAVAAAMTPPGQIATLILPADTAWNDADGPAPLPAIPPRGSIDGTAVTEAARRLRTGGNTALLLADRALREDALHVAGRIAKAAGARLLCPTLNNRLQRGAGRVALEDIPYPIDRALAMLADIRQIILIGAKPPVAFFAYPNKPSLLTPEGCAVFPMAAPDDDLLGALEALADELGAPPDAALIARAERPAPATGALTVDALATSISALMPDHAIIADEGITVGRQIPAKTRGAPPHDWLQLTGGAIGLGLPMATGAAIACPDRPVISLQADGSAMYTLQALWTQAREGLNITTVIFANRAYACLRDELTNVGADNPGRKALDMLDIGNPDLDWVALAKGMGVEAGRATSAEEFNRLFATGLTRGGPYLIEAVL